MPVVKSNPFIEYSFTDEELTIAAVFTELQTAYIETALSQVAVEKTNLSYTPGLVDSERLFIYQQEYLRGRMEALQELLNTSEDRKASLIELHRQMVDRQASDNNNFYSNSPTER